MIRDGRLVDTAHLRSQKCAVSEANAQFCPLILPLTIQQIMFTALITDYMYTCSLCEVEFYIFTNS